MAFADELLDLARRIAALDGENPQQASRFHPVIGGATQTAILFTLISKTEQPNDSGGSWGSQSWLPPASAGALRSPPLAVAFRGWIAIRDPPDAQEFLVLLLGPKQ